MRLYTTYTNRRGNSYGTSVGGPTHTRGWHAGVKIWAYADDQDRDAFTVSMTGGSSGHHGDVVLGTVTDTADGPAWEPARRPGITDLAGELSGQLAGQGLAGLDSDSIKQLTALRRLITRTLRERPDPAVFGPAS